MEGDEGDGPVEGDRGDGTTERGSEADGPATDHCEEAGCREDAAVRLHVPWRENLVVCTGHARTWAQKDGVVAEPLEGADWP